MKINHRITLLSILTLSIMSGCSDKTKDNIQASIEASKIQQEQKNIEITHITNIEKKEKNYKTVTYYTKHKKERAKKYRECEEGLVSNYTNDKECDNALMSKQEEKNKNSSAFIHQQF